MASLGGSVRICRQFFIKYNYKTNNVLSNQIRWYGLTGNVKTDEVLTTVTGGRIDKWLQKYEEMVGLTEIKEAQHKVIQAEKNLLQVQTERRQTQHEMATIQTQLRKISMDLDKVQRGDERYLKLLTEEHVILKDESKFSLDLENYEDKERLLFAELSSAVRESHEKERARSDRTKYWSIIGSIIGASIGILGTSINNYLRMRELKGLVRQSTGEGLKADVEKVTDTVQKTHNQMITFIKDLKALHGVQSEKNQETQEQISTVDDRKNTLQNIEGQTANILNELQKQDDVLQKELGEMKTILGLSQAEGTSGNVVYVGPNLEEILESQNKNIEWKIKMNALWTTTLVYGAFALTLPVLYGIFKGG